MDYSSIHRCLIHYALLEKEFRIEKRKPCGPWRLDETCIKVKGQWKYFYRAMDKKGEIIEFLLTARRDIRAALRFLRKDIGSCGKPNLINIEKSNFNLTAILDLSDRE